MVIETRREKEAFIGLSPGAKAFEMQLSLDSIEAYTERAMTNKKGDQLVSIGMGITEILKEISESLKRIESVISAPPVPVTAPISIEAEPSQVIKTLEKDGFIMCSGCGELKSRDEFCPSYVRRYRDGTRKSIRCKVCDQEAVKKLHSEVYWPLILKAMDPCRVRRGISEGAISEDQKFSCERIQPFFLEKTDKHFSLTTIFRFMMELRREGYIKKIDEDQGSFFVLYEDVDISCILSKEKVRM